MIQIRKIREWTPTGEIKSKKFDRLLDDPVTALSVPELFKTLDTIVAQIPEKEKWNLYYTSHPCQTTKRIWNGPQEVLPFDIDGLDIERLEEYIFLVLETLKLNRHETGIVFSGNGLQFIIGLSQPIQEESFFEKNREHYKALCAQINRALENRQLLGKADPSVFSPARLLRLPGTENRKAGKVSRFARLIESRIEPITFDLQDRSGLPKIQASEALPVGNLKHLPVDSQAVKECAFLKWMKASPADISEPQWFAGLSILGRLQNGPGEAHDYSKGHSGYNFSETETKLAQALSSSGPRTCKNINSLWGKCHTCPHFEKVNSPISIRGENFIATETTGFHDVIVSESGKVFRKPNFQDLQRFFAREHQYKVLGASRICYTWNGKYYREFEDAYLENFAQHHFKPFPHSELVLEFRKVVQRMNLETPEWFENTTDRKTNFQNGVLGVDTMEFTPHSPDRGFRYVLSYDYDPRAICPTWDIFLHDICQGDESLTQLLLEYAGYALSNDTCWAQIALVLTGVGENGKSTFMNILRLLAGAGNYMSLTMPELAKEGNRQLLDGKLFNIGEETPTEAMADSTLFKNLTGGGEVSVRQLYKRPYIMRNKAKLIFACNELPAVSDTTHGFFRRLLIVPFGATFSHAKGNRDDFIEKKLALELPGIFNKCIQGYQALKLRKKFGESHASTQALDSYQLEVNNIKRWALETLVENQKESAA